MPFITGTTRGSNYIGTRAPRPINANVQPRDPTPWDNQGYALLDEWLNSLTNVVWQLISLKGNSTSNGYYALWVKTAATSGDLISLTGDDLIPVLPLVGNINVFGSPQAGSSVTFTGATPNTLKLNTTDALGNTIIGHSSGNSTISGLDNTGLGFSALHDLTSGNFNVAIGEFSLADLTTGSNNTSLGALALNGITNGASNIAIGEGSGSAYNGAESNNILIANTGINGESNVTRIGSSQTTSYMAGVAGVSVSNANLVTINTITGQLGSTTESPFATTFDGNTGSATPSASVLNIVGDGVTATTSASGNTVTITAIGGGGGGTQGSIIGSSSATSSAASITFIPVFGSTAGPFSTLESVAPLAGTINNLYVNVIVNASTSNDTITLYKNGSPTSLVANITATTTGVYFDTTHTVSILEGDLINFSLSQSTTSTFTAEITAKFNSTSGSGTVVDVLGGNNITITGMSTVNPTVNVSGTTNHCVQIGNSTGSLTSVANGTTGDVLTAQTGADPIWTTPIGGSGGLVLLQTQTVAGVTSVAFTSGITGTYNDYLLAYTNMTNPTAGPFSTFNVQISTNGGVSYINSGYSFSGLSTTYLLNIGNTARLGLQNYLSGQASLYNMTSGSGYIGASFGGEQSSTNGTVGGSGGAYLTPSTIANAIQIIVSDGSVFSGKFSLYGYTM